MSKPRWPGTPGPEKVILPPDDSEAIQKAAAHIMRHTPALVNESPIYTIGAMSLALGTAAALARLPYKDLIELVSRHYESQLLAEVQEELEAAGERLPPLQDGSN